MIKPSWSTERVVVGTAVVRPRIRKMKQTKNKQNMQCGRAFHLELRSHCVCGLGILIQFWNTSNHCKGSLGVIWNMWLNSAVMLGFFFSFFPFFFVFFSIFWTTFSDFPEFHKLLLSLCESHVGWKKRQWDGMGEIIDPELLETKQNPDVCSSIFNLFFFSFFSHHFPKMGWVIFSVCPDWKNNSCSLCVSITLRTHTHTAFEPMFL